MKAAVTSRKKSFSEQNNSPRNPFTVVAIGASAGGLEAISQLLQNLSPETGMAFIIVQHLSPDHKSMLTELLAKQTEMHVQEVEDMEKMVPDNVYVIPFDKELVVTNGHIKLVPRPKNRPPNLSIDLLFSSLALTHKANVIGVVLSGNGNDGTQGLKEIKMAGGVTFAQDSTAKFGSMPESAIFAGVVDFEMSPKEIALEIMALSKHPLIKGSAVLAPEDEIENGDPDLITILEVLHKRKNVDFSRYKMSTVKRRILRRMLIHKIEVLKSYAELVVKTSTEADFLYADLLINVTTFFRDAEAFALLKKSVLAKLINEKSPGETLRFWVAACSTGEEVYSIAMCLIELQEEQNVTIPFQIFASDLSADVIHEARNGEYTAEQVKNVSEKRLQRFFTKARNKYRIAKSLRDVCVFAQHNVLTDPPFSRMDFISCRNFLIYLEPPAQRKAISTFHYALNEGGWLMLGKSETIGTLSQLFAPINKTYKIYQRKNHAGLTRIPDLMPRLLNSAPVIKNTGVNSAAKKPVSNTHANLGQAFDEVLLNQYIPASVVINHDLEILQYRGNTSLYLVQTAGKATFNILKLVNPEITFELRNAIHHAIKSKKMVRKSGIELSRDEEKHTVQIVNVEVAPLHVEGEPPLLVVVFTGQQLELTGSARNSVKNNSSVKDRRIKKLEEELASARYDMGSITRDQEAVNEELQSANEEVVSSNEELQSLNEELETSKEEIESTNEELSTTNHELQARIHQIEELQAYYEGILSTIYEPMLILDKDMRIKSANSSFCKMFHAREDEITGVQLYKLGEGQWNIPRLRELLENVIPQNNDFHNFEMDQTFPLIGQRSMLLNAHRIVVSGRDEELIVLTISDVTEVKRMAIELLVRERKVLELELSSDKEMIKKIAESNKQLIEAKLKAEVKTQIAEDAVRSKQQFLSNMSHEIRTPMNAIIGFTNVMLKTELTARQREFIRAIKTSGEALTVLINDILDLAKVDAGKMVFEKRVFRMEESMSSILHLFETKIREKNVTFIKEYDPRIPVLLVGDPVRLHQVILNLVGNAEKFTLNGQIKVSLDLLHEDEKKVTIRFAVADTGIGIAEDQIDDIFENFQQAYSGTSRLYGGTGLGLAIVKQLIEPQGGTISVKSEIGVGSTFSFILSFDKTNAQPNEEKLLVLPDSLKRKITVLVVEDVALNQLLLKTLLDDFGFSYDSAANGKLAIEKLNLKSYDLILMDLQMPEMDGFEATEYIRNTMKLDIPIVALTADVTTADFTKCKAYGMDDYISKPVDEKVLYEKIVALVS